jgi:nicotinamidase-related amidase
VLFTAHDAYLRGYALHVARDCVASESAQRHAALAIIETTFKASIALPRAIHFRQR